jgi:hypothetical protein
MCQIFFFFFFIIFILKYFNNFNFWTKITSQMELNFYLNLGPDFD